jgi:hypothetical protein
MQYSVNSRGKNAHSRQVILKQCLAVPYSRSYVNLVEWFFKQIYAKSRKNGVIEIDTYIWLEVNRRQSLKLISRPCNSNSIEYS